MPIYTTWNPADKNPDITLSGGDLTAVTSGWWDSVRSIASVNSGKHYWEVKVDIGATTAAIDVLVANADFTMNQDPLASADTWSLNGNKYAECMNEGQFIYGDTWGAPDILSVALDMDAGKIWIAKNGTYPNSGNPATGANPMCSDVFGTIFAAITLRPDYQMTANFGASAFSYSVPSGFRSGLYEGEESVVDLKIFADAEYLKAFSDLSISADTKALLLKLFKTDIAAEYLKAFSDLNVFTDALAQTFCDLKLDAKAAGSVIKYLQTELETAYPVRERIQLLRHNHIPAHNEQSVPQGRPLQLRIFNPDPQFGVDPATFKVKLNGTTYKYGDSQVHAREISYREWLFYVNPPVFDYGEEVQAEVYCEDHLGNPGLLREVM